MALTTAQLATLKADILADNTFASQPHNSDGGSAIAAVYNTEAAPAYVIWRNNVTRNELQQLDTFDWTQVDNLTVGKFRIWDTMFMRGESNVMAFDPSKANVRAGIAACWVGNASLVAVQTAVLNACKINATRAQKLFATGTGTTLSPGTTAAPDPLASSDIIQAMGW